MAHVNRNFYPKQFAHEKWHIYRANSGNVPLFDNAPDGKDKPLVFNDLDSALEFCEAETIRVEAEEKELDSL